MPHAGLYDVRLWFKSAAAPVFGSKPVRADRWHPDPLVFDRLVLSGRFLPEDSVNETGAVNRSSRFSALYCNYFWTCSQQADCKSVWFHRDHRGYCCASPRIRNNIARAVKEEAANAIEVSKCAENVTNANPIVREINLQQNAAYMYIDASQSNISADSCLNIFGYSRSNIHWFHGSSS
uniref:Uncharacterized protein n=1 Tax=Romanomermis culicivorax TaxID=13658 RepID=A0A915HGL9_ROMCU